MEIKEILKDSVTIEEVARGLNFDGKNRTLGRIEGNCPTGHASESQTCFHIHTNTNSFYCWHCGIGGDIFRLVEKVKNIEFRAALEWVIDNFRPDLKEEFNKGKNISPSQQIYYKTGALYEMVFEFGKKLLYKDDGKDFNDYMVSDSTCYECIRKLRRVLRKAKINGIATGTKWLAYSKHNKPNGYMKEFLNGVTR